jgi:hypothetical protein
MTKVATCETYLYEGEDPLLKQLYADLNQLSRLALQMRAITAAHSEVKGMLNEADLQTRLGKARFEDSRLAAWPHADVMADANAHIGACHRIMSEQMDRRCEYFRTRAMLEHSVVPLFVSCRAAVIRQADEVRKRLDSENWPSEEEWTGQREAMVALQAVEDWFTEFKDLPGVLTKAQAAIDEAGLTQSAAAELKLGERSFEMIFSQLGKTSAVIWSGMSLDMQLVDLPSFAEDDTLWCVTPSIILAGRLIAILPTLAQCAADVEELEALEASCSRAGLSVTLDHPKLPELSRRTRLPELFRRVKDHAQWCATQHKELSATLQGTIAEVDRATQKIPSCGVRLIAQSNRIGAHIILYAMRDLCARAHKYTPQPSPRTSFFPWSRKNLAEKYDTFRAGLDTSVTGAAAAVSEVPVSS